MIELSILLQSATQAAKPFIPINNSSPFQYSPVNMVNSEEIRKAAVDFFTGRDYLRDGDLEGKGSRSFSDRAHAAGDVFYSDHNGKPNDNAYDLQLALETIRPLFKNVREDALRKVIYQVWAGRTLWSAAQIVAGQIESDAQKVAVPCCTCEEEGCPKATETRLARLWEEKSSDPLYRHILYLSGYMPRNMGNFRPLRWLIETTANKFSRTRGQPKDRDFDTLPTHLREWEWQGCRFDQGETMFKMVNAAGSEQTHDLLSLTGASDVDLLRLQDAATRILSSRGFISSNALNSLVDTSSNRSDGGSGTVVTETNRGDVTTGFNLSLQPPSPEKT